MSQPAKPFRALGPVLVWLALLATLGLSALYGVLPGAPLKIVFGLGISLVDALLIGLVFMRLDKASPLIRLTAGAGALWLFILFVFLFSDYLTRPGG